jgi:hypothetical protein
MSRRRGNRNARHSSESGYAYLMALFMMLAMLAGSVALISNGLTQSKRQREEEMIWRGNQYVRAIRLYFHKTGHYPQTIDDLQKGLPQLHFLRQAYKDPMNSSDGAWRFIYINSAGQIIGSEKYASLQQMAMIDNPSLAMPGMPGVPQLGVSAASLGSAANNLNSFFNNQPPQGPTGPTPGLSGTNGLSTPSSSSGIGGSSDSSSGASGSSSGSSQNSTDQQGQQGSGSSSASSTSTSSSGSAFGQPGQLGSGSQSGFSLGSGSLGSSSDSGQLGNPILQQKPTGAVDGPVLGGFLTGIGSKVDEASIKVLHGGKKYKQWEFIWNPLEDQAAAMQQGIGAAGGAVQGLAGGQGGMFGSGSNAFGNIFSNGSQPGQQNPNQPQSNPGNNPQQPNQSNPQF